MNDQQRAAWLAQRREGIGGSDVAAILGLSPWRTAVDVWLDKTGAMQGIDSPASKAMYWGNVLEDVVAREYAKGDPDEGRAPVTVQRLTRLARHPKFTWAFGTLDRVVVTPGSRARIGRDGWIAGVEGLLECKTADARMRSEWDGEDNAVPVHYLAQCLWYLGVTGAPWIDIAALIGGNFFVVRRIERDEDAIRDMIDRAREFWLLNCVALRAPEPASGRDVVKLWPHDDARMVPIDDDADTLRLLSAIREARDTIDARQAMLDAEVDAIKLRIGEHAGMTLNGKPIVTWKTSKESAKTDWEAVAGALHPTPELIAQHTTRKSGSRRFIIKEQGNE